MYYGASRIMCVSSSIQHPNSALLWSSVKLRQNLRNGLDSGSRCSAAKTMDVYRIHLYHLPSTLPLVTRLHRIHAAHMVCTSISTHEQKALGMAVPVQRRHVAQLRIVVGILVLLIIRMYYIGYQIDRIGLPKR